MNKELKMLVEIPKGSNNKYEYNEKTQHWELDRVLSGAMHYPEEYGSIPKTLAEDGDPLDVICITNYPTFPGLYVPIRIIGLMKMIDNGEQDDKIIAVNAADPRLEGINGVLDLSAGKRKELLNFFSRYKELEKKEVIVEDLFENANYAIEVMEKCRTRYNEQNKQNNE